MKRIIKMHRRAHRTYSMAGNAARNNSRVPFGVFDSDRSDGGGIVDRITELSRLQKTLYGKAFAEAKRLHGAVMRNCRQLHARASLRDIWDTFLLFYDEVSNANNGGGDGGGGDGATPTLQFMFQPDLGTRNYSTAFKIGHHYTRAQGRYLRNKLAVEHTDAVQEICLRTVNRLINQYVMQDFIPLRITRPERIFDHFGNESVGVKNGIFSSIRGLHIPVPPPTTDDEEEEEADEEEEEACVQYSERYGDYESDVLVYDSSFRDAVAHGGRGGGAAGDYRRRLRPRPRRHRYNDLPTEHVIGGKKRSDFSAMRPLPPGGRLTRGAGTRRGGGAAGRHGRLLAGRETWKDSKRRLASEASYEDGDTASESFIKSGKAAEAHYRKGYVLDLFCHDSQRSQWSSEALRRGLELVAEDTEDSAAKKLMKRYKDTIGRVMRWRRVGEDARVLHVLRELCVEHRLIV